MESLGNDCRNICKGHNLINETFWPIVVMLLPMKLICTASDILCCLILTLLQSDKTNINFIRYRTIHINPQPTQCVLNRELAHWHARYCPRYTVGKMGHSVILFYCIWGSFSHRFVRIFCILFIYCNYYWTLKRA